MFNITKISTPDNEPAIMLDVKNKKIGILSPLGPHGATYILAFPSLGYISLVDAGSTVRGPGDWSVKASGSETNWFYRGNGEAHISVEASGEYTISGGSNTIKGKLTPWQL